MTLVNRVSFFFLAALAVCLLACSLTFYLLVRQHLYSRLDGQLRHALNVLTAAVEVEIDGVKWQPSDHTITLGNEREEDEVRWIIVDQQQHTVDESGNLNAALPPDRAFLDLARTLHASPGSPFQSGHWRILQSHLAAPSPKPSAERDLDEFEQVTISVARDSDRLRADLFQLALLAFGLPFGFWILAAVLGRAYCSRALKPVGQMAAQAHSMTSADFARRLPVSPHRDELASMAEAFNGLLARLQSSFEAQQRFTGDAAHQLKTPLTILRGQIDVALRRPRSPEEYRLLLDTLSDQTAELQQIVETLLLLARTEGTPSLPELEPLPLAAWLPDYLEHWRHHPRFADLHLDPPSELTLLTSPPLLRQSLDNLIGNALKYTPPGTPVLIQTAARDDQIEIAINDSGQGIPPAEQSAIFEPFYRSPVARTQGIAGTGLGLAIVAQIARRLGGSVHCHSRLPHGTRFSLLLPHA